MGSATKPDTILYGLNALKVGLGSPSTPDTLINGATRLQGGLDQLAHGTALPATPVDGIKPVLDGAKAQLDPKLLPANGPATPGGDLAELIIALNGLSTNNPGCSADPTCKGTTAFLAAQVTHVEDGPSDA